MSVDELDEFTCRYAYAYGEWQYNEGYQKGYEQGKKDAVKHGRWIINENIPCCYCCSECGHRVFLQYVKLKYCPECGSKMDGE